jgi:hypothetical protein
LKRFIGEHFALYFNEVFMLQIFVAILLPTLALANNISVKVKASGYLQLRDIDVVELAKEDACMKEILTAVQHLAPSISQNENLAALSKEYGPIEVEFLYSPRGITGEANGIQTYGPSLRAKISFSQVDVTAYSNSRDFHRAIIGFQPQKVQSNSKTANLGENKIIKELFRSWQDKNGNSYETLTYEGQKCAANVGELFSEASQNISHPKFKTRLERSKAAAEEFWQRLNAPVRIKTVDSGGATGAT